jgi:hypothetical protein
MTVNSNAKKNLDTLGHQVQSVVSTEYFPNNGNSRVYIELSGNWTKECTLLISSSNPTNKISALCPQLHSVVVKHKVSRE